MIHMTDCTINTKLLQGQEEIIITIDYIEKKFKESDSYFKKDIKITSIYSETLHEPLLFFFKMNF